MTDVTTAVGLVLAGAIAGAVNAVAGGGSLVSFPMLLAAGVPALVANGTNSVALVPGAAASAWEYRKHLGEDRALWVWLLAPSLVGGALGTGLALAVGNEAFEASVPALIIAATSLFAVSERVGAWAAQRSPSGEPSRFVLAATQLPVAIYGGYFGAGMGILMLAAYAMAGVPDLHRRNALKSGAAVAVNGVAAVVFLASGSVDLVSALALAVGAILGGRYGARLALRLGRERVRWLVIAIGVASAAWAALG